MTVECPVCHEGFENDQGRGGHVASLKDAPHEAYRALGALPSPGAIEPSIPAFAPLPSQGQDPAPKAEGSTYPEPTLQPLAEPGPALNAHPSQQEGGREGDVELVAFEPPVTIEPLKPSPGEHQAGSGSIFGEGAPRVTVPFEPIIAGTTALSINAFFLREEGDQQLALQEVRGIGFSRAVDACLKLYFPEVGTDHPLVALMASSMGLAFLVMSKKAKKNREAQAQSAPSQASTEPSPASTPPSPIPSASSTGDPYWDSILRNAGGVHGAG